MFALTVGFPVAVSVTMLLATGTAGRFVWLFQQAAPFLIFAWPISIPTAIWLFYSHTISSDAGRLNSRRLLWLAPLIVIPITTLVWGAIFERSRAMEPGYIRWQLAVVHWMFSASVVNGVLAVLFNPGRRSFVAAATIMLLLFAFSCAFTAGSSVTGDWL